MDSTTVGVSPSDRHWPSPEPHLQIILLDGGFATECERRGASLDSTSLWSSIVVLRSPELARDVHEAFLRSGSDVVSTATYQISAAAAVANGTSLDDLTRRAVGIARGAIANVGRGLVGGSLGPYGATIPGALEFTGQYTAPPEGFRAFHRARIDALLRHGIDFLLLETFPRADEAIEAACAAHEAIEAACAAHDAVVAPNHLKPIPVSVSMTMRAGDVDGRRVITTAYGDPILPSITALSAVPGVSFVGANCCDPTVVTGFLEEIAASNGAWRRRNPELGLAMYPNSGEKYVGDGQWDASHLAATPAAPLGCRISAFWPEWHALCRRCVLPGQSVLRVLVGGCCRVFPEDIAGLRSSVRE